MGFWKDFIKIVTFLGKATLVIGTVATVIVLSEAVEGWLKQLQAYIGRVLEGIDKQIDRVSVFLKKISPFKAEQKSYFNIKGTNKSVVREEIVDTPPEMLKNINEGDKIKVQNFEVSY